MNYYFLYTTFLIFFKNTLIFANHKQFAKATNHTTQSMHYFLTKMKFGKIVAKRAKYVGQYPLHSYNCCVDVYQATTTIPTSDNYVAIPARGYFYLDMHHKDHLEVFDSNKYPCNVINLKGYEMATKKAIAVNQQRRLPNYR